MQKVIREHGTKQIIAKQNKNFTESKNSSIEDGDPKNIPHHNLGDSKRKKLMDVMNDLVELRKKLDQN